MLKNTNSSIDSTRVRTRVPVLYCNIEIVGTYSSWYMYCINVYCNTYPVALLPTLYRYCRVLQ